MIGPSDSLSGYLPQLCSATCFISTLQRRQHKHREQPYICTCGPFGTVTASRLLIFCHSPPTQVTDHITEDPTIPQYVLSPEKESLLHTGSKHRLLPCQGTPTQGPSFALGVLHSSLLQTPSILHFSKLTTSPVEFQLGWEDEVRTMSHRDRSIR